MPHYQTTQPAFRRALVLLNIPTQIVQNLWTACTNCSRTIGADVYDASYELEKAVLNASSNNIRSVSEQHSLKLEFVLNKIFSTALPSASSNLALEILDISGMDTRDFDELRRRLADNPNYDLSEDFRVLAETARKFRSSRSVLQQSSPSDVILTAGSWECLDTAPNGPAVSKLPPTTISAKTLSRGAKKLTR